MGKDRQIGIVIDGLEPGGTDEVAALVANQFAESGIPCRIYMDGSKKNVNLLKNV